MIFCYVLQWQSYSFSFSVASCKSTQLVGHNPMITCWFVLMRSQIVIFFSNLKVMHTLKLFLCIFLMVEYSGRFFFCLLEYVSRLFYYSFFFIIIKIKSIIVIIIIIISFTAYIYYCYYYYYYYLPFGINIFSS